MVTPPLQGILLLAAGATSAVLNAAASAPHPFDATGTWAALTLGGSVLSAALSYCLRLSVEKGRLLFGRSLGSLVGGVLGSRWAAQHYPSIKEWSYDPLMVVLLGLGFGLVSYAVSYPLVNLIDKVAPKIGARLVSAGARFLNVSFDDESKVQKVQETPTAAPVHPPSPPPTPTHVLPTTDTP